MPTAKARRIAARWARASADSSPRRISASHQRLRLSWLGGRHFHSRTPPPPSRAGSRAPGAARTGSAPRERHRAPPARRAARWPGGRGSRRLLRPTGGEAKAHAPGFARLDRDREAVARLDPLEDAFGAALGL